MVTTRPRPRNPKAYTILESIVVIGILVIFSWVVIALINHNGKSVDPANPDTPVNRADDALPPVKPSPPSGGDVPSE